MVKMICYNYGFPQSNIEQTKDLKFLNLVDNNTVITKYIEGILEVPKKQYVPILEYISQKHGYDLFDDRDLVRAVSYMIFVTLYN